MTAEGGYLFAYFTTQDHADGEQVRFARSVGDDPLHWQELNLGEPVLRSDIGAGGVRDPFLVRAAGMPNESARFYLIGTDLRIHGGDPDTVWQTSLRCGSRSIIVWESQDLITWMEPRLVTIAPPGFGNVWAPEVTFDAVAGAYAVYWAGTPYPDWDADHQTPSYNRMYLSTTTDFREFSPPRIWVDPGWPVIDSTIAESAGSFYRFTKDERSADSSLPIAKFLTLERSSVLASTDYEFVAEGIGGPSGLSGVEHAEGPIVIWAERQKSWYLFIDEFGLRRYVPFSSPSLEHGVWTMCGDFRMPAGASHGSILRLNYAEWRALAAFGVGSD